MGTRLQPGMLEIRYRSHTGLNNSDITPCPFVPNFSREPPFLLRRLSYMRDLPPGRADKPRSELAWMVAAVSYSKIAIRHWIDASAERHFDRG
jgi:hypothetical protein